MTKLHHIQQNNLHVEFFHYNLLHRFLKPQYEPSNIIFMKPIDVPSNGL
jgi:hypothetical protein